MLVSTHWWSNHFSFSSLSLHFDMHLQIVVLVWVSVHSVFSRVQIPVGKFDWQTAKSIHWSRSSGLIFSRDNRDVYTRLNALARDYVSRKFQRAWQYDLTELIDKFDADHPEIDSWSRLCRQVSQGIISIIGDMNEEDSNWLAGFSSAYQIPWLSLNHPNYLSRNSSISLMPDVLPALVALIRRYQIHQLVYIYDDIYSAQRLKQLMQIQTSIGGPTFSIISRYLDNPEDSYDLLENIELVTNPPLRSLMSTSVNQIIPGRYIVLDLHSFDTYRILMDKIKHRGMTTSEYHYVLMILNAKQLDMTYFRYGGVNVTFFTLPTNGEQTAESVDQRYLNAVKQELLADTSSIESLLLADAWQTLIRSIDSVFESTNGTQGQLRGAHRDNDNQNLTTALDCRFNQIPSWSRGESHIERLLNTSFRGLTGHVQFSNTTGQRINYTFDIHRVTRNEMPKQIGFFREPSTFQVKLTNDTCDRHCKERTNVIWFSQYRNNAFHASAWLLDKAFLSLIDRWLTNLRISSVRRLTIELVWSWPSSTSRSWCWKRITMIHLLRKILFVVPSSIHREWRAIVLIWLTRYVTRNWNYPINSWSRQSMAMKSTKVFGMVWSEHWSIGKRTCPSLLWRSMVHERKPWISPNHSSIWASQSWFASRKNKSLACSPSWTHYRKRSGCVWSSPTYWSALFYSLSVDSRPTNGISNTNRIFNHETSSPCTTPSSSLSPLSCIKESISCHDRFPVRSNEISRKKLSPFPYSRSSGHECLVVFQFDSGLLLYCQSGGFSHCGEIGDTDWNSGRSRQTNRHPVWNVERRFHDGILQQIDLDHIQAHVEFHATPQRWRLRLVESRGHRKGSPIEREICLSSGIDHERIRQRATPLRYDAHRREHRC